DKNGASMSGASSALRRDTRRRLRWPTRKETSPMSFQDALERRRGIARMQEHRELASQVGGAYWKELQPGNGQASRGRGHDPDAAAACRQKAAAPELRDATPH